MTKFKAPPKALMCSRFINGPKKRRYKEFKDDYAQKVREENGQLLENIETAGDKVASLAA